MTTSDHLDKIFELGFWICINWNEDFNISYNASEIYQSEYSVNILSCSYLKSQTEPYTFEEMVEVCCDFFYSWYNKNIAVINEFDTLNDQKSLHKLEDTCLGNITKVVARELNLTDILDIIDDSEDIDL